MTETLAHSSESTRGLSNKFQHDRVFKNHCVLVLWMKVASALEGLNSSIIHIYPSVSENQAIGGSLREGVWEFPGLLFKTNGSTENSGTHLLSITHTPLNGSPCFVFVIVCVRNLKGAPKEKLIKLTSWYINLILFFNSCLSLRRETKWYFICLKQGLLQAGKVEKSSWRILPNDQIFF